MEAHALTPAETKDQDANYQRVPFADCIYSK